jgi:ubiquitin-like protein Pup
MPQEQEHVHHSNRTRTPAETHAKEMGDLADEAATKAKAKAKQTTGVATADAAADWLDEIDEALEHADTEEQAQAFLDSYVQKGGE